LSVHLMIALAFGPRRGTTLLKLACPLCESWRRLRVLRLAIEKSEFTAMAPRQIVRSLPLSSHWSQNRRNDQK
jgi:hypothetical protein